MGMLSITVDSGKEATSALSVDNGSGGELAEAGAEVEAGEEVETE